VDPVTLIVSALSAGAVAAAGGALEGLGEAAKDAVTDLYQRLRTAIAGRAQESDPSVDKTLDRHAKDPEGYEVPVRDIVTESGADHDAAIIALAEQLLAAVQSAGGRVGGVHMEAHAKGHGRNYQAGRDMNVHEK
jgi:hypothetical protein